MSGATAVEEIMEAREVFANVEFYGDVQVSLACRTIERLAYAHEAEGARALRAALEYQIDWPDGVDYVRAAAAVEVMTGADPAAQYLYLKTVCTSKGTWSVPEDLTAYMPVWFEVTLFGVSALAESAEDLPINWCRAARRVLDANKAGDQS